VFYDDDDRHKGHDGSRYDGSRYDEDEDDTV
jgi:hypothetical protein